jgi:hypothetical protein
MSCQKTRDPGFENPRVKCTVVSATFLQSVYLFKCISKVFAGSKHRGRGGISVCFFVSLGCVWPLPPYRPFTNPGKQPWCEHWTEDSRGCRNSASGRWNFRSAAEAWRRALQYIAIHWFTTADSTWIKNAQTNSNSHAKLNCKSFIYDFAFHPA